MKYQILAVLLLTGCSTTQVPVKINNPYVFPASLVEECKEPEFINPEAKLSDTVKIIVENNTKFTECRVTKRSLVELIQQRKEIFDRPSK